MSDNGPEKIWIDRFDATRTGTLFNLSFTSGGKQSTFVFDAVLAKKIAKFLSAEVKQVEAEIGQSIDDRLDNEPAPSPLSGDFDPKQ